MYMKSSHEHSSNPHDPSHSHSYGSENSGVKSSFPSAPSASAVQSFAIMIMAVAYFRRGISWDRLDDPSSVESPYQTLLFCTFVLTMVIVNRKWVPIRRSVEKTFRFLARSSKNTLKSCRSSGAMQTLSNVSSCETLSRLSRVSSRDALSRLSTTIRKSFTSSASRRRASLQAITTKECFARLDYIEQLSVGDLTVLFRYAASVNHADFNRKQFLAGQSDLIRAMVTAIDLAASVSRGSSSEAAKIASDADAKQGNIDALYFLATTRIFAEWRTVRLVPNGFKRYSVAMNLAYRDVLQNLTKIESAVHAYLKYHLGGSLSDIDGQTTIPSPSLRQLLQYELDTNVHPKLPRLTENSAASGLLWAKRQLHYQEATFTNVLQVPVVYPSSKDAGGAAYTEVYEDYHGWAVKHVFQHSFGGSPPVEVIWKAMVPPKRALKASSSSTNDSPRSQRMPERKLSEVSEDTFPLDGERPENEIIVALDNFGKHITGEWNKLLSNINCVTDEEHKQTNLVASAESFLDIQGLASTSFDDSVDDSVVEQQVGIASAPAASPVDKVKREIKEHIQVMWPIVGELTGLIEELNMNDPTRV